MAFNKYLLKNYLFLWGMLFVVALVIFNMPMVSFGGNPILRPRLDRIEPFVSKEKVNEPVERIGDLEPAEATINQPREPYSLLKGVLPLSKARISPNSQHCYEADFQPRIEKTGNYRQLTNNYKRGAPDSCSSPLHEFVLSFYKPPPI